MTIELMNWRMPRNPREVKTVKTDLISAGQLKPKSETTGKILLNEMFL
jgi:hypothetical protein